MPDLKEAASEQKKKTYTKKLFRLLQSFYKTFSGDAKNIQMIDAYMAVYKRNTNITGVAVLPVKAAKKLRPHAQCRNPKVDDVFFAYLSYVVEIYWAFLDDVSQEPKLLDGIMQVQSVSEKGLGGFTIVGTPDSGYVLKAV